MKKLFALLLSLGTLSSVFAQKHDGPDWSRNDRSKEVYNQRDYSYSLKERDIQIQRVNRDFAMQVQSVRRDWRLKAFEKNRKIQKLERQRDQQIREINERFSRKKGRDYDDRSVYNNRGKY
jgi:hypothetical protein